MSSPALKNKDDEMFYIKSKINDVSGELPILGPDNSNINQSQHRVESMMRADSSTLDSTGQQSEAPGQLQQGDFSKDIIMTDLDVKTNLDEVKSMEIDQLQSEYLILPAMVPSNSPTDQINDVNRNQIQNMSELGLTSSDYLDISRCSTTARTSEIIIDDEIIEKQIKDVIASSPTKGLGQGQVMSQQKLSQSSLVSPLRASAEHHGGSQTSSAILNDRMVQQPPSNDRSITDLEEEKKRLEQKIEELVTTLGEKKTQMDEIRGTGIDGLVALQSLANENKKLKSKYKQALVLARQSGGMDAEGKSLKVVIAEQSAYIDEQNSFLQAAAEEVESLDRQIVQLRRTITEGDALNAMLIYELQQSTGGGGGEEEEEEKSSDETNPSSRTMKMKMAMAMSTTTGDHDHDHYQHQHQQHHLPLSLALGFRSALGMIAPPLPSLPEGSLSSCESLALAEKLLEESSPFHRVHDHDHDHVTPLASTASTAITEESHSSHSHTSHPDAGGGGGGIGVKGRGQVLSVEELHKKYLALEEVTIALCKDLRQALLAKENGNDIINGANNFSTPSRNRFRSHELFSPNSTTTNDVRIGQSNELQCDLDMAHSDVQSECHSERIHDDSMSMDDTKSQSRIWTVDGDPSVRVEELETRNRALLRKLDREVKAKLRLEAARKQMQAEIQLLRRSMHFYDRKASVGGADDVTLSRASSQSSMSIESTSRPSLVPKGGGAGGGPSSGGSHSSDAARRRSTFTRTSNDKEGGGGGGVDKLMNISSGITALADPMERLLIGWEVAQHFKIRFPKKKKISVDIFSKTLKLAPVSSQSNRVMNEAIELTKIARLDRAMNLSLFSKTAVKPDLSCCLSILLYDGVTLDLEFLSTEERDDFFDGLFGVLCRFNSNFRMASELPPPGPVDGNGTSSLSFPFGRSGEGGGEDMEDRDTGTNTITPKQRNDSKIYNPTSGSSRTATLKASGSGSVSALKAAGVISKKESGLRELGLLSDDEGDEGTFEPASAEEDEDRGGGGGGGILSGSSTLPRRLWDTLHRQKSTEATPEASNTASANKSNNTYQSENHMATMNRQKSVEIDLGEIYNTPATRGTDGETSNPVFNSANPGAKLTLPKRRGDSGKASTVKQHVLAVSSPSPATSVPTGKIYGPESTYKSPFDLRANLHFKGMNHHHPSGEDASPEHSPGCSDIDDEAGIQKSGGTMTKHKANNLFGSPNGRHRQGHRHGLASASSLDHSDDGGNPSPSPSRSRVRSAARTMAADHAAFRRRLMNGMAAIEAEQDSGGHGDGDPT
eukprot:gene868-1692_t